MKAVTSTFVWDGGVIDGTDMPVKVSNAPDLMSVGEGDGGLYGAGSVKRAGIYNVDFICNRPTWASSDSVADLLIVVTLAFS